MEGTQIPAEGLPTMLLLLSNAVVHIEVLGLVNGNALMTCPLPQILLCMVHCLAALTSKDWRALRYLLKSCPQSSCLLEYQLLHIHLLRLVSGECTHHAFLQGLQSVRCGVESLQQERRRKGNCIPAEGLPTKQLPARVSGAARTLSGADPMRMRSPGRSLSQAPHSADNAPRRLSSNSPSPGCGCQRIGSLAPQIALRAPNRPQKSCHTTHVRLGARECSHQAARFCKHPILLALPPKG